jgi:hypothetical protein
MAPRESGSRFVMVSSYGPCECLRVEPRRGDSRCDAVSRFAYLRG